MKRYLLALAVLATAACTSESQPGDTQPPPPNTAATVVALASATPPPEKAAELHVTVTGTTMAFTPTALTVKEGQTVHLTIENKLPGALPHNWALVMPGTEAQVAADGLTKGEAANYIAPGPNLLANTPLVKPGNTADVTFKAPDAGKYPYICTFPGHYLMMHGVLTVTPQ